MSRGSTKRASAPAASATNSKTNNLFLMSALAMAVGAGFLAVNFSAVSVDDLTETLALRLLEILPRKPNSPNAAAATANTVSNASVAAEAVSAAEEDLSKLSTFDPVTGGFYDAKKAMEKRYQGLHEACLKYNDFLRPESGVARVEVPIEAYEYHPGAELAFCKMQSVASKSVKTFFGRNVQVGNKDWETKKNAFRNTYPKSVARSRKAILVRHPFERIVSAYR